MTKTIAVVRHAPYETLDNLWEENVRRAIDKWAQLVKEMGIPQDVSDILLVSSSAPRAIQTAEALRTGMGLPDAHAIHASESLWKDDLGHQGNIEQALAFVQTLPDALFMVVVTHGIWQQIRDTDETSYQFLVPKSILPTGDPGYSMSGGYDREGIFPIQIIFHTQREIGEIEKWRFVLIPEISQIEAMEWIFGKLQNTDDEE